MNKPTDFAYHLTTYLTTHLRGQRNLSVNTVHSYRDTFKLLLRYCHDELGVPTSKVAIKTVTEQTVSGFLGWLKTERGYSAGSLKQRLASIHAFFAYVQDRDPSHILRCQQILSVKLPKAGKPLVGYLSIPQLEMIFAEINEGTKYGRRNAAMLRLLYDSGARVQELCDLCVRDVLPASKREISLRGKGNKGRYAPIVSDVANRVSAYISENGLDKPQYLDTPLFFNQQRQKMSRAGVAHIIRKYADSARVKSPLLPPKVTPHIFRHSKAMHLVEAGIDIIYIRDILGHVDIKTTEIYAKMHLGAIQDALEKAYPELPSQGLSDWTTDDSLMRMLNGL